MNEREYNRLKKQVNEEYARKLVALDLVYEMSRSGSGGLVNSTPSLPMGELSKAVRMAVDTQITTFTVREIEEKIIESQPEYKSAINRTSISSALKRLEKDGYIVMIERGKGKRASRYGKKRDGGLPVHLVPTQTLPR